MCRRMVDIHSETAEIRRGKKKKEEDRKPQGKNIMSAVATQGGHNNSSMHDSVMSCARSSRRA